MLGIFVLLILMLLAFSIQSRQTGQAETLTGLLQTAIDKAVE